MGSVKRAKSKAPKRVRSPRVSKGAKPALQSDLGKASQWAVLTSASISRDFENYDEAVAAAKRLQEAGVMAVATTDAAAERRYLGVSV